MEVPRRRRGSRKRIDVDQEEHSDNEELEEEEDIGLSLPGRLTNDRAVNNRRGGFAKTSITCYRLLSDALYTHQWQRAAELFTSYVQTLESHTTEDLRRAPEVLWRLGSEILRNHPNSMPEDLNVFSETMKNIGVKSFLLISLEQAFSLLCNGQTEEAYRLLTATESWRFGRVSMSQNDLLKLIQAYRAALDYRSWVAKRSARDSTEMGYAAQSSNTSDASSFFRQATVTFEDILQHPGVWDPFVLSYVNLLESSGNIDQAEKVLATYAYNNKNPANPNAHIYLYELKKRKGDSPEKLIKVLKILHMLVPSHKLMLEFSELLRNSELDEHHELALQVLFDLVDFSGWKDNVEAWKCFSEQLTRTLECGQTSWISAAWTSRSDWWPSYHFTQFQVKKDWMNCKELALIKASVAALLQGKDCRYFTSVYHLGNHKQRKALDQMKF